MEKPTIWVLPRSGTNRTVQSQKQGLDLSRILRDCNIRVAKTKALISFAVIAKLVCAFVFANANYWFSHAKAQILINQYPSYLFSLSGQIIIF